MRFRVDATRARDCVVAAGVPQAVRIGIEALLPSPGGASEARAPAPSARRMGRSPWHYGLPLAHNSARLVRRTAGLLEQLPTEGPATVRMREQANRRRVLPLLVPCERRRPCGRRGRSSLEARTSGVEVAPARGGTQVAPDFDRRALLPGPPPVRDRGDAGGRHGRRGSPATRPTGWSASSPARRPPQTSSLSASRVSTAPGAFFRFSWWAEVRSRARRAPRTPRRARRPASAATRRGRASGSGPRRSRPR